VAEATDLPPPPSQPPICCTDIYQAECGDWKYRPKTRQFAPNLHDRREILRGLLKKQESFAPADQHWNEAMAAVMVRRSAMPYDGLENRAGSGGARTRRMGDENPLYGFH
jgi:hypothetical protein